MHDFNFYKLTIEQIRWIGGFGKIAWLDNKNWNQFMPKWSKNEMSIIEHMNKDHLILITKINKDQQRSTTITNYSQLSANINKHNKRLQRLTTNIYTYQ